MGQVFTMDAIRRGQVPRLESFTEVVAQLRERFDGTPSVVGALVCGSVVRGDHTLRSDIDCFVMYDSARECEAYACMQELSRFAAERYVPLGFVPCDTVLAQTRMHHVGASFLHHLQRSAVSGGLLKGDPLAAIASSVSVHDELESYMRVKMYNLQEAWASSTTFSDERKASYLRKLLEAPLHIARKVLAHQQPLEMDSKAYIRTRYMETMPRVLGEQLQNLINHDAWYTEQVMAQQKTFNESSYQAVMHALMGSSEEVLSFIRGNLVYIAEAAR